MRKENESGSLALATQCTVLFHQIKQQREAKGQGRESGHRSRG